MARRVHGYLSFENISPNVYAAGMLTDSHFVVPSAAAGALAAMSIYEELLREAIKTKMKGHKFL